MVPSCRPLAWPRHLLHLGAPPGPLGRHRAARAEPRGWLPVPVTPLSQRHWVPLPHPRKESEVEGRTPPSHGAWLQSSHWGQPCHGEAQERPSPPAAEAHQQPGHCQMTQTEAPRRLSAVPAALAAPALPLAARVLAPSPPHVSPHPTALQPTRPPPALHWPGPPALPSSPAAAES